MRPYYEQDGMTIYHGDCREVLPTMTADAFVTDPPYGLNMIGKGSSTYQWRQGVRESRVAAVCYQDDPDHVRALIGDVFPPLLTAIPRGIVFSGPRLLWAYPEPAAVGCVFTPNGAGRCAWGFQCMHPVLFYGQDPLAADGRGMRPNSIRTEQPNADKFDHPCPKPVSWMVWAVGRASRVGETVIDPFLGTGTTLVAAKRIGRKGIGIEREESYCEIAANRLRQGALQFEYV